MNFPAWKKLPGLQWSAKKEPLMNADEGALPAASVLAFVDVDDYADILTAGMVLLMIHNLYSRLWQCQRWTE